MTTILLAVYAGITIPIIAGAVIGIVRSRKKPEQKDDHVDDALAQSIMDSLRKSGIHSSVTVERVPHNASEAVVVYSDRILKAIAMLQASCDVWYKDLRNRVDINKKDMDAVMMSVEACTKGVMELQKGEPDVRQSLQRFINSLEYARDTFATSKAQRSSIEVIINNVKEKYASNK